MWCGGMKGRCWVRWDWTLEKLWVEGLISREMVLAQVPMQEAEASLAVCHRVLMARRQATPSLGRLSMGASRTEISDQRIVQVRSWGAVLEALVVAKMGLDSLDDTEIDLEALGRRYS